MTREEWEAVEAALHKPEVQLAMRGRCEEQGHDWENGASFLPLRVYRFCKWCGERR
jgi:hypothetical protein